MRCRARPRPTRWPRSPSLSASGAPSTPPTCATRATISSRRWTRPSRSAGAPADLEGLVHRLDDMVALVAHVGGVDGAPLAERLGDLGHLVGRGRARHRIEQAARHAYCPLLEAL